MRILIIGLFLILSSVSAYGEDFFPDSELKDLRVVQVDREQGKAWVRDKEGNEGEVWIGDTIGADGRSVVETGDRSITVQLEDEKTIMPAYVFENVQMNEGEPPGGFPALPSE